MANRVLLGKTADGVYGVKVSKEGQDVTTVSGSNLLLDSTNQSGNGRYFQAIYARDISGASGGTDFNHSFGSLSSGRSYTQSGTEYHYLPLGIAMEDAVGTFIDTATGNYYNKASSAYLSYVGTSNSNLITDVTNESGAFHSTFRYSTSSNSTVYNGDTYVMQSHCFAAGAGDLGVDFRTFHITSNDNDEWSEEGATSSRSTRVKYRKANGQANNTTWFRKNDGGIKEVSVANSGGIPCKNASGAIYAIPCGYGYMTPEFMGFNA